MNDIDYLQDQINNLYTVVKTLVEKQGLVMSINHDGGVCTPEQYKKHIDEWKSNAEKMSNFFSDFNKIRGMK